MRNINEENKSAAPLAPRHLNEENPMPSSDVLPRPKDEENPRPDEKKAIDEENQLRSKDDCFSQKEERKKKEYSPKKVASISHAVSGGIATVAIVLVVASAVIIGKDFFKTAPSYVVNKVSYVDDANSNGIVYDLTVSKNPDKVPLILKSSYVDEFGREKDSASIDITEAKNYSGILPTMKYPEASYSLKIIRTDHNSNQTLWSSSSEYSRVKETKFYGFYWDCHCVDLTGEAAGKAYYQLEYVDDFGSYGDFTVHLTKLTDKTVSYSFACEKPYTDRHLVETRSKEGGKYSAEIVETPPGGVSSEVVYTATVSI
jgi:hypothetical protein